MQAVPSITPSELHALPSEQRPFLLDVREPEELEICALPFDAHIPLDELPNRLEELDSSRAIVVYCRSGRRSETAVRYLMQEGFVHVRNLEGGILRHRSELDPSLRAY